MVGVFVAFIRVVYGRMIYMSLPIWAEAIRTTVVPLSILIRTTVLPIRILIRAEIHKYYEECDLSKKWTEGCKKKKKKIIT